MTALTLDAAVRMIRDEGPEKIGALYREFVKDKSYQLLPLGQQAAAYLRVKRKRLTDSSHRDYERGLDKLARYFPDLGLEDFEPPTGTQRLEEFLDYQYGDGSPRNYNKNLSILRDFFKSAVLRGHLHGDPTLPIERARARQVYRTTFNDDQRKAIIASADELRDRIALRLLLNHALRKGALKAVQFKHFDYQRRRLTIFTKGQKVREVPIPHPAFWTDLERHVIDVEAQPNHFLMCRQKTVPRAGVVRFPDKLWATTASMTGGTSASKTPAWSRKGRPAASGCTRPGTPPVSACLTRQATSKRFRSCLATRPSRPPATSTPTGTSTSSPPPWPTSSLMTTRNDSRRAT